nr:ABC transporter substrate-binding protein [Bacteroides coprosuis]
MKHKHIMHIKPLLLTILCVFIFTACGQKKKKDTTEINHSQGEKIEIKYAKGFSIQDFGDYKLIDVQDPSGESELKYQYALIPRGTHPTNIPSEYLKVETPVRSVICMTSLQISNFIKLDAVDRITGITSTRFLFNEEINKQLEEKKTHKIGIEGDFDSELVIALNPDMILVSPFKRGGYDAIRNLEIPLISFLGYKEVTPLGQAEWIKFTAALLGLEDEANVKFKAIEDRYLELKALVENVEKRPTVLSGELHSGNWYVVGGESYLAQLFRDAGAQYFMKNDNESGGFYVDFETVYSQGAEADFWRIVNSYNGDFSYDILKQTDGRYADFKAYKEKKVIYSNLREVPFYEQTPVEPEVILADLIKVFHPTLLSDHEAVYYKLLTQ